jgi:hypothetical protein
LGTKYLVVLCAGSTLPLAKQGLDEAPYKLSGAVAKLAGITFSRLAFFYWIDNLGFITERKLAAIFIKIFSWGFQLAGHLFHQLHANKFSGTIITAPSTSFLAPLPGKKKTSARGVSHSHPLLCFKFCFYFILLALFYQKKN